MRSLSVATQVVAPVRGTLDLLVIAEWLPAPIDRLGCYAFPGCSKSLPRGIAFISLRARSWIRFQTTELMQWLPTRLVFRKLGIRVHYGDQVALKESFTATASP